MRGFCGFGSNMLMAPLFALIFGPVEAVMIAIVIDSVATAALLPRALNNIDWPQILPISAASVLVFPFGVWLLISIDAEMMRRIIAGVLIVSALILMSRWRYRGHRGLISASVVGAASGILGATTSMSGPPVVLYLLSGASPAVQTRAGLNMVSGIFYLFAIGGFFLAEVMTVQILFRGLMLLPLVLLFTWIGSVTFSKISDNDYRKYALWFLLGTGVFVLIV